MVERYLAGPQVSTESILLSHGAVTPGFSDRNYELLDRYAPYFIENGGDLPSCLPQNLQDEVKHTAERAGRAMGVVTGNVKGDMVVHEGRPYVIELAARASGGYFCTDEIPLNTGVDFVGAVIKLALGEPVSIEDVTPQRNTPVVQRYAFPAPGRVLAISGEDEARRTPGVAKLIVTAKPGDVLKSPQHAGCTAAMVLATGNSIDAAKHAADTALSKLRIETVPDRAAA
jgi:biotin carboxylase